MPHPVKEHNVFRCAARSIPSRLFRKWSALTSSIFEAFVVIHNINTNYRHHLII
jgi:hypothetical protein